MKYKILKSCVKLLTIKVLAGMYFLLNFREYSDDFCDVPDLELCLRNNDQEILEMEVDITPETDDDSYSSSFDETDSDDGKDEFNEYT